MKAVVLNYKEGDSLPALDITRKEEFWFKPNIVNPLEVRQVGTIECMLESEEYNVMVFPDDEKVQPFWLMSIDLDFVEEPKKIEKDQFVWCGFTSGIDVGLYYAVCFDWVRLQWLVTNVDKIFWFNDDDIAPVWEMPHIITAAKELGGNASKKFRFGGVTSNEIGGQELMTLSYYSALEQAGEAIKEKRKTKGSWLNERRSILKRLETY
jgi:hypothetical protein